MAGYGCYEQAIKHQSTDEFLEKVKKMAQYEAQKNNVNYCIVRRKAGNYNYMPEQNHTGDNCGEIILRISPM